MLDLDNLTGEKGTVNSPKGHTIIFLMRKWEGGGGQVGENNGPT